MRGNEYYVNAAHGKARVKAKRRVIRSVLDRESDLKMDPSKSPQDVADEMAALSLTLSDPAKTFARFLGIADEVAALQGEYDGSSSSCEEDPEILSDVLSCDSSSSGGSSCNSSSFHDCTEEIVPHPSLIRPRAMRVAVPKRIEKKLKKTTGSRRHRSDKKKDLC